MAKHDMPEVNVLPQNGKGQKVAAPVADAERLASVVNAGVSARQKSAFAERIVPRASDLGERLLSQMASMTRATIWQFATGILGEFLFPDGKAPSIAGSQNWNSDPRHVAIPRGSAQDQRMARMVHPDRPGQTLASSSAFTGYEFEAREDADAVLARMDATAADKGNVTVADYKDLCGQSVEILNADYRDGWVTDQLRNCAVRQVFGRPTWYIALPPARHLY